jgi:hypothetical protein
VIERVPGDGLHPTPGYHHVTLVEGRRFAAAAIGAAFTSASTLLGVTALGFRDQLVELDLTAALSGAAGTAGG